MARIKSNRFTGVYIEELKSGDKSYYIVYKDSNGKKVWQKIGKHSEGIREPYCNQKRNEILNKIRLGEDPNANSRSRRTGKVLLDEITEKFFKDKELHNKDTYKTQNKYKNWIQPYIGDKPMQLIFLDELKKLQNDLSQKLAPASVNFAMALLHSIFEFAIEIKEFNGENPLKKIKKLKVDNTRERYLEVDECKRLIECVEADPELYFFVKLSLSTGGRLETILSIKKKDISFSNRSVTLSDHKAGDTYTGFLNEKLADELQEYCKMLGRNDNIVNIPTRTLRRRLTNIFNEEFNEGLEKDDRKNRVVVHTLRHTFASLLAIDGAPIFTIQKLMNHKDIKTTLRYAKLAKDQGRDFIDKMGFLT